MGAVVESRYRGSYYLELPEEREYAQRLVAAAEALGLRGGRLVAVAKLARETAWLVGLEDRGTDPRALAAAAVYWAWLVDHLRGLMEAPSPQRAWRLTGSSRASFYRAIAVLARYVLRLETHHPLLRLEARLAGTCSAVEGTCSRPGSHVVGVEPSGYVVLCSGRGGCRPPRGAVVELLLLPGGASTRRTGAVNGYLRNKKVTYDLVRLREIIAERFGLSEFQTHDFAAITGLTPQSAGKLLSDLERYGIVERVGEARWRLRETLLLGRKTSETEDDSRT